ncbi:hypothetical protein M422DRAFT_48793 [Sphaerobolus stellatus SS14]|uniref:Eisosome component PIL1-domain-containing protein n=1 Tax=Sphaerobolus stellatus (strain SS14) TaxID=990650 RepID=A0A0C9UD27_SPHS4|nr:hypothetical protein M422DRAFT_48793 [Sphaerobolus stellatus SS14]
MFRSKTSAGFAAKLAHTSTIPALGNKDLRLLQDLITNEKTVMLTLQKLSGDLTRASESLKAWGLGEGDDLGDVLSHACGMYTHIAAALNNFANHQSAVRSHLKSIRTREEQLDELKRKRKNVAAKADTADKKLSKMSGEHKNLPAQTDLLNRLRDEIRQLDTDILVEEARLGDFKRSSTRNFMGLKLGGLLEFGEKATIIGELGKLLIEEIPLDPTPPGQSRAFFQAHTQTANFAAEATRCVGEVVFNAPTDATLNPDAYAPPSSARSSAHASTLNDLRRRPSEAQSPTDSAYGRSTLGDLRVTNPTEGPTASEFGESTGQRRYGTGPSPSFESPRPGSGPSGGQFSTFPVKMRADSGLGGPNLGTEDFSASVASALRLGDNGMDLPPQIQEDNSYTQMLPQIHEDNNYRQMLPQTQGDNNYRQMLPQIQEDNNYRQKSPPPSVNVGGRPWNGSEYSQNHNRTFSQESTTLPYTHLPEPDGSFTGSTLSVERGVRFRTPSMEVTGMTIAPGVASPTYPSAGSGWAHTNQAQTNQAGIGAGGENSRVSSDGEWVFEDEAPVSPVNPHLPEQPEDEFYNPYEPTKYASPPPESPQDEERLRNAAAAREIALEIDAQLASSPTREMPPSPQQQSYQSSIPAPPYSPVRPLSFGRAPSPLAPPQAPFSQQRSVSPNPPSPNTLPTSPVEAPRSPTPPMASPMADSFSTPPEYPSPPPLPAAGGPRTISAAAFKRAGAGRLGSTGSDLDLTKKRPLPSSPYPPSRSGTPADGSQDNAADYGRLPAGARASGYFDSKEPSSPIEDLN